MLSKLKLIRQQKGMKQKIAAKLAGISPTYLCMIENNSLNPTREILFKLSGIYQVPVKELT